MAGGDRSPEGFDVAAVESWIAGHVDSVSPPFVWTRLEGGHSNLTYRLDDRRGHSAVIRRPPRGELLPRAHDMGREWAVISALGSTSVPVPTALEFCDDPEITGARFYLMGLVPGRALHTSADAEEWIPESRRGALGRAFIDVLADLHSLDPTEIGLSDLGRHDAYVARQLRTWYSSWTSSAEPAGYDDERVHELRRHLAERVPDQGPARLVHGDYGLHNCLVDHDGTLAAVLDWEISTLGDPLADLGYALNRWAQPGDAPTARPPGPTAVSGFPSRRELAARYAERSGRDLSSLDYYLGFNWWKSACIVHGVYARYRGGKKSSEGVDLEALRADIGQSLDRAVEALGHGGAS